MCKVFRLSGLFLFILALCVYGCSGSGSSADPMGTGTVQFVAEYSGPITTGSTASAPVLSDGGSRTKRQPDLDGLGVQFYQ